MTDHSISSFKGETLLADAKGFTILCYVLLLAESMTFDPTKPTDVESMTSGDYTVWRTGKQNEVRFGMIISCYGILRLDRFTRRWRIVQPPRQDLDDAVAGLIR